MHLMLWYLQILTYGRRVPLAELFARIDAVDTDTVKRVASRFIFDKVRPLFILLPKVEGSICSLR